MGLWCYEKGPKVAQHGAELCVTLESTWAHAGYPPLVHPGQAPAIAVVRLYIHAGGLSILRRLLPIQSFLETSSLRNGLRLCCFPISNL